MEVIALFKLLETFKLVYETRNFSKAAELLFISQPTVSTQIKQLEADLDTILFIRNGRITITATPQADVLYDKALDLLDDWATIREDMHAPRQPTIHCKIGVSHTFAMVLMPDLLIDLSNAFPHVSFSIKLMNSAEVAQAMNQHELDLGIIEKPLATPALIRTPLMTDQLVLAGDTTGPWLIRETASGVYYYTKRYLEEQNIQGPIIEIASNALIVSMLKKGFGCSIVSKRAAADLPFQSLDPGFERHFYLLQREDSSKTIIHSLKSFIQQWALTQNEYKTRG